MNWDLVKGDWQPLSRRLKQKWKKLSDAELIEIAGRRDKLEGILQERYGYDQVRALTELDAFITGLTS